MTLLTADDVLNKKFQATKFREGYEQDEVDEFLDEVVEAMRQLEAENADLKAKLEAANRRVAHPREHLREWPTEPHHDGPHPIRMVPLHQSPVTRPPTKGGDPHGSPPFAGYTAHSSPVLL